MEVFDKQMLQVPLAGVVVRMWNAESAETTTSSSHFDMMEKLSPGEEPVHDRFSDHKSPEITYSHLESGQGLWDNSTQSFSRESRSSDTPSLIPPVVSGAETDKEAMILRLQSQGLNHHEIYAMFGFICRLRLCLDVQGESVSKLLGLCAAEGSISFWCTDNQLYSPVTAEEETI
jgi:hypothetical protein